MVIELIFEGFESALLPCSLILLLPGVAVALAARQEATAAVLGFVPASVAVGWLRFSNRIDDPSPRFVALGLAAAIVLLLVPLVRRLDVVSAAGGALAGGAAAALWLPCVGEHFGNLLDDLPNRGVTGIVPFAFYLIGVMAPVALLAAVLHLIPGPFLLPVRPFMMVLGGVILGALALTAAVGLDDDLVGRLVELSL